MRPRRLHELLLARATESPSPAEAEELARLLAANPDVDGEVYERVAAAVCLATLDTSVPLPTALRANVERQAAAFLSSAAKERR